MSRRVIIANWKANPNSEKEAILLARKVENSLGATHNVEVILAPPFVFMSVVKKALKKIKLGAQDVFWAKSGPFTGEVSLSELKGFGVKYVIVGHSERRLHLGETDDLINKKIKALLESGFSPILCVGERKRSGDEIPAIVGDQLNRDLAGLKRSLLKNLIIAYEPVWAISSNPGARADTTDNAFRAKIYIRRILAGIFDRKTSEGVKIIYGGSVGAKNIAEFLSEGKMDGALVGGASLNPKEFTEITKKVSQS